MRHQTIARLALLVAPLLGFGCQTGGEQQTTNEPVRAAEQRPEAPAKVAVSEAKGRSERSAEVSNPSRGDWVGATMLSRGSSRICSYRKASLS